MKNYKSWRLTPCLIGAGLLCAGNVGAHERSVKLGDLPASVRKTVVEQSKDGKIRGLAVEVEGGKTSYEAELTINGRNKDILINPVGMVTEVEEQTDIATLPPAVKMQLEKAVGKGKVTKVEAISKNGAVTVYEAQVRMNGKKSEIKISPSGNLIPTASGKKGAGKRKAEDKRKNR